MIYSPNSPLFLEIHQKCHVTGSTCGAAIGIGKFKCRQEMVNEKKYPGSRRELSDYQKSILDWGNRQEIVAIKLASIIYPIEHPAPFSYLPDGFDPLGRQKYDLRYGATPDGFIGDNGILEIKCPITQKIYPELLDPDPYVPIEHFCQVMMEMACHQRHKAAYVCWTPTVSYFMHVSFSEDIWNDIYGHLLEFSQILERDLPAKFKSGEKQRLIEKFIGYSRSQSILMFWVANPVPTYS